MAAEIVGDVTKKNAIIKSKVLYEAKGQAPAPSKDYVSVVITEKGVIWRRWKITLRGLATKTAMVPLPYEAVMTYEDYMYDDAIQVSVYLQNITWASVFAEYHLSGCMCAKCASLYSDLQPEPVKYYSLSSKQIIIECIHCPLAHNFELRSHGNNV